MREHSVFKSLDLAMLPTTRNSLIYEDEFLLLDTLSGPEQTQSDKVAFFPFKINFTTLLFCVEGTMHFRVNLKEYELQPNHVMTVAQGSIGECIDYTPNLRVALIAFTGNDYFVDLNASSVVEFRKYLMNHAVVSLTPEEMEETLLIYHQMRKKLENPHFGFVREALKGYMQVLSANGSQWLRNNINQESSQSIQNRQKQLLDRFLALVQEHYLTERSIQFYADKLCLTPKYLSQVIRETSGRYAGDWIKDYVILEAKALLKSKKYTVQQVSDRLHFSNASFFGKFFKATVGCSPRRYSIE